MRRAFVTALAGCLALGAAAVSAATPAPADGVLLARHRPLLVLHPLERFTPSPVEPFLAASELLARAPDGTWAPQPGVLPVTGPAGSYRLDVRGCSPRDALVAIDCYASLAGPPTAYGIVHRRSGRIVLQYWLFYPYNHWSPVVPQSAEFWQVHEGDWEEVSVLLDARSRPQAVGLSRHCAGVRRAWPSVSRRGSRPVVHVSLGSHANGFRTGAAVVDRKCWPKEAVAVYTAYGIPMLDHAGNGRTVSPAVVRVSATSPAWLRYPGTWGEDQYAGFPNAVFRFGTGPTGPAFQDDWRDPAYGPLRWPLG